MPLKGIKGGINSKSFGLNSAAEAVEETDAEFNQTVLLLHGDGSEGAGDTAALGDPNYKAFKDNSTSAHAITVQGDAYGNDFSPYYYADGYWSNQFDASSNTIDISSFPALGTDDFTIEAFVYFNDGTSTVFYDGRPSGVQGAYPTLYVATNTFRYFTNSADQITSSAKLTNTWYHVALVRSSGSTKLYVDGTQEGSTYSDSANYLSATDRPRLGNRGGTGFDGSLSNVRVVKGTAIYTSNFTSPTAPLTAVTNTELLICQSNRFLDNSSSSHSLSITGTPKISTNTPFTVTKTANVGSGFFDGTGDYLTVNSDIGTLTGDFTIECFFYQNTTGAYRTIFSSTTTYTTSNQIRVSTGNSNDTLRVASGGSDLFDASSSFNNNEWNHVALVRSGTTLTLYLNGTSVGSATNSTSFVASSFQIGDTQLSSTHYYFDGYIADTRVVNGTAVYTSNFTPPTTTLTSTGSETKLLTCQYSGAVRNVGFLDDSKYNHQITRGGDATMGTFSPFSAEEGYWSNYFDGDAYHLVPDSDEHNFGTGDFTIEMFVYGIEDISHAIFLSAPNGTTTQFGNSTAKNLHGYLNNTDTITKADGVPDDAVILNQWNHIVLERSGTNLSILSNGTRHATVTYSSAVDFSTLNINRYHGGGYEQVNYISNLRIVKGSAVYDADSYTVPTAPLTAIPGTTLLTCQSNRFIDNSTTGHTITPYNGSQVQPFSPFAPSRSYSKDAVGGSLFVDGSDDVIYATESGSAFTYGTGDYEFSCWVYRTVGSTQQTLFGRNSTGDTSVPYVYITSGNKFAVYYSSSIVTSSADVPLNAWCHLVASRVSGTLKLFQDGVEVGSVADAANLTASGKIAVGGQWTGNTNMYTGYIADVRVRKGTGVTSVTVPTAPISDDTNTSLLLNFTNAGIIDHTMKNNFETEGNTRISGQQVKFGTGSIYFDGTTDKLVIPHTSEFLSLGINGEPFTIEVWAYPTNTMSGSGQIISKGGGTASWSATSGAQYQWTINSSAVTWNFNSGGSSVSVGGGTVTLNTWQHLAVTYDGTTTKTFLNGTQQNTSTSTYTAPTTRNLQYIGMTQSSGYTQAYYGYLDDFRITKGTARYTSSFTAPTKAFANR